MMCGIKLGTLRCIVTEVPTYASRTRVNLCYLIKRFEIHNYSIRVYNPRCLQDSFTPILFICVFGYHYKTTGTYPARDRGIGFNRQRRIR